MFAFIVVSEGVSQNVFPLLPKYYQPIDTALINKNADESEEEKPETLLKKHERFTYSVAVGTGYSSFGNNFFMMNSYIAPTINYQLNSKLNVSVNGYIMQSNLNGMEGTVGINSGNYNSSPSNYGISGMAYYQLSDRWSIYADGAYFENQSVFNDYRANVYETDFKTVSVGVNYKVNDNLQFNVQYRYSNGLNPYYNRTSPFYDSFISPYRYGSSIWDY